MKKKTKNINFAETEADANALTAKVLILIFGNDYDEKVSHKLFNKIKEQIEEKLI